MDESSFEEFCRSHSLTWETLSIESVGALCKVAILVSNGKKKRCFTATSAESQTAIAKCKIEALQELQTNPSTLILPTTYINTLCKENHCDYSVTFWYTKEGYEGKISITGAHTIDLHFLTPYYTTILLVASEKAIAYFQQL